MQTFLDAANILLPLAYLLAAVAYGFLFFNTQPAVGRWASPLLRATVVPHAAALAGLGLLHRQFPAATVSGFAYELLLTRRGQ